MKQLVLLVGVVSTLSSTAWAQLPAGAEFHVNTYTTSNQLNPAVAGDGNGNFVVVWESYGQDGSFSGVFGKRFDAQGMVKGSEFRANTYTTFAQKGAAVASDANGNFVVVWTSRDEDGDLYGIFGRRFNASGAPQASEFRVNSYTTGTQFAAAVAADGSGNFVVVWQSPDHQTGSNYGIFGQRFDAAGAPQGSEFQINSYTTGLHLNPAVASDDSGNFVVVWASSGGNSGVFGRRFNAVGAPQGSEFKVNSYTTGNPTAPSVAADAGGNLVVVWQNYGQDGSGDGAFGRRFNAAGVPVGSEFQVNTYTTGSQSRPVVASDKAGSFVVVWENADVFGQRFTAAGTRVGSEFQVNTQTTGYQTAPAIAASADGDFVVAWQSNFGDSNYGIFGQRYGDLIFKDGFESGDLGRWSSAQTGSGDLSAGGAAGMAGTGTGLQALVNDTGSLFVQDNTPSAESRYRVRFYFDPNGFDPGEAASHFRTRILIAFDQSSLRTITLVLKRQLGAYSVEARVKRNDGTRADTGFFPIADGPHFLEFDWQHSTGPGASDGSLQLWIDGISMTTLTGIDNDQSLVESVRMGALSIKTAAAGTPYYDQFESRRQILIGAE